MIRNHFVHTYHKSAFLDQKVPKALHNSFQNPPGNATAWLDRHDMYRRTIAQIIVERVLG